MDTKGQNVVNCQLMKIKYTINIIKTKRTVFVES